MQVVVELQSNYLPAAAGHVLLTYGSLAASETGLLKIGLKTKDMMAAELQLI